jgi:hypothetical protein
MILGIVEPDGRPTRRGVLWVAVAAAAAFALGYLGNADLESRAAPRAVEPGDRAARDWAAPSATLHRVALLPGLRVGKSLPSPAPAVSTPVATSSPSVSGADGSSTAPPPTATASPAPIQTPAPAPVARPRPAPAPSPRPTPGSSGPFDSSG